MTAATTQVLDEWARVHSPDCPLHLEERDPPLAAASIAAMLARQPFMLRHEGPVHELRVALPDLPGDLVADIEDLAHRFARLMSIDTVKVRIERTDSNACRKVHSDFTDIRLITTYIGPGTDVAPHATENNRADCCLERVPTGWIGLFKGRNYGAGHPPCFHRSPPAGDLGEKRLVLVIDTPGKPE